MTTAQRVKLTKQKIDLLACPPGRRDTIVFDTEIPGFALRVTDTGSKVFILQYRRAGLVQRLRLGAYGELTPAEARRAAEAARGQVVSGHDPVAVRKATLAAEAEAARARRVRSSADALTLGKMIDEWETRQLASRSVRYRTEATRALRRSLASMLTRPAHAIDAAAVRTALDRIPRPIKPKAVDQAKKREKSASPLPAIRGEAMARRVRAYGSALYTWANGRELVTHNPFAAVKPETRETQRDRVLTDAELGEIWRASGKIGWPWGPYVRFLLLTMQREAETAGLEWIELAPDRATWAMPGARTKNNRPHVVHLAAPAQAILKAAPRIAGSHLVFTTTGRTPISGFSKAKTTLDAAIVAERARRAAEDGTEPAPLIPWRWHDFRRSGVTVLARLGVRCEVADKVLNHVAGVIHGVAAVYQRHNFFDERCAAMTLWAEHLLKVGSLGDEKAANTKSPARAPRKAKPEAAPPASRPRVATAPNVSDLGKL